MIKKFYGNFFVSRLDKGDKRCKGERVKRLIKVKKWKGEKVKKWLRLLKVKKWKGEKMANANKAFGLTP